MLRLLIECLYACLSACICLCVHLIVCASVCLSVCQSVCLCVQACVSACLRFVSLEIWDWRPAPFYVQRSGFNRIGWRFLGLNSSAVGRPFRVRLCRRLWQVPIYRSAEFRGEL